ncbi:MAG: DUF4363 family protein [Clostridia bacterium]|nr:DUF4363 family protein [Clostridia bacterium]
MKAVAVALILLTLSLGAVIANSIILNSIIDEISDEVERTDENDLDEARERYEQIYSLYQKRVTYISLTTNHEDLTNIEECFSEIIGAAKANDRSSFIIMKSRLTDALRHLKRLSGINIESIF